MKTIIDSQYENGNSLIAYLRSNQEITLSTEAENNFRKTLLLSAASFFEKQVTEILEEFSHLHSKGNLLIFSVLKSTFLNRQYFKYFKWEDAKNANSFFSLFGEEFKKKMETKVRENENLDRAIRSFLQIGFERNKLVHQNFAEINLEKTAEEVYNLFKEASYFVETIRDELLKED